jgi:hypothetical protein
LCRLSKGVVVYSGGNKEIKNKSYGKQDLGYNRRV